MQKPKFNTTVLFLGISNFILLAALFLIVGNGALFQARLGRNLSPSTQGGTSSSALSSVPCEALVVSSIPDAPLPANTSALISVKTIPEKFSGLLSFSATSGIFSDLAGNLDSFIETPKTEVSYSGGITGSTITIQAKGKGNEHCLVTVPVVSLEKMKCTSLSLNLYPAQLSPEQSAEVKIIPQPSDFTGTFLVESGSGKFQIATADNNALGNNTSTLVTTSKSLLFSGGKANEKIIVRALGDQNDGCIATFQVSKK